MKDWRKTLIRPDRPVIEAMRIIDDAALQIVLVVDGADRLLGVVTDGDIRRAILRGIPLESPIEPVMCRAFTTVAPGASQEEALRLMKLHDLRQIPIVDEAGRVVGLRNMVDMIRMPERPNWVVIMAGGLGNRLHPLTESCPKPLLQVGDKPLLETIVGNFAEYGFREFFVSVHYRAEMIESFLGDGSRWGVRIRYLREAKRLGTAGALGLLPARPDGPLVVMNGDVLTKVNWQHLLDFHQSHRAKATMCVRDYHLQVPYGVIQTDQQRMIAIDEKPIQQFLVNAGIYVLEPEMLDLVSREVSIDMTDLFETLCAGGGGAVVFPVREYWMDIGQLDDLKRANGEYAEHFPGGEK